MKCPSCGGRDFEIAVSEDSIRQEIDLREKFFLDRIEGEVTSAELKDRIDVVHDSAVDVFSCTHCHLLFRKENGETPKKVYKEDSYDESVMERFLRIYIKAFREREVFYRGLLPEGANALEIGSYVGGFLHVAKEWGWGAVGLDVGKDVSKFANAKGYITYNESLEECHFSSNSFDGVFIWNCFDQIAEPHATLEAVEDILKEGGVLVIRTPNGLFYRLCEMILEVRRDSSSRLDDDNLVVKALGYNNLLGFPYQYGYSSSSLNNLLREYGFQPIKMLNSSLITLPSSKTPDWAIEEEQKILGMLQNLAQFVSEIYPDTLTGPWMEISYRKLL